MKYKRLNKKKVYTFEHIVVSIWAFFKLNFDLEKKISSMSQDEILNLSRLEYGDDITNHKDYATFFSN